MAEGRTIIVGAGGFGREVFHWATDCHQAGLLPAVSGFLDDDPNARDGLDSEALLLGTMADFRPLAGDRLLVAIGDPGTKERVANALVGRGAQLATLIHPSAIVAGSAKIGAGSILCPLSLVSANAVLGELCTVNAMSSIGHDVTLGDFSTLSAHIDLTGRVSVGRSVFIGSGAKILPGVKVGDGVTIGAGSVVYRSVPAGRSVFAPPAKVLRPPQP